MAITPPGAVDPQTGSWVPAVNPGSAAPAPVAFQQYAANVGADPGQVLALSSPKRTTPGRQFSTAQRPMVDAGGAVTPEAAVNSRPGIGLASTAAIPGRTGP